jgi:hypothetical protein
MAIATDRNAKNLTFSISNSPPLIYVVEMDEKFSVDDGPLTHIEATRRFLLASRKILNDHSTKKSIYWTTYLQKGHVILSLLFAITLFIGLRNTCDFFEAGWITLVIICNGMLHVRELRIADQEIYNRLNNFLLKVSNPK